MKISIENFKSIKKLKNFEIKPFTVLSGVNSAGKSSFVQLLLILKQTIELDSSKKPFFLNGEFYNVNDIIDVISNRDLKNKLKISFEFNKSEIEQYNEFKTISIFKTFDDYNCTIEIYYDINKNREILISIFSVKFNFADDTKQYITIKSNFDNSFSIKTNTGIFGKELFIEGIDELFISNISYSSFYPISYESTTKTETDFGSDLQINTNKELINLDDIKVLINSFLQNISYIGPNREVPKDEYSASINNKSVGSKGEFTAQILQEEAKNKTAFNKIENHENGITYKENKAELAKAVKYWMCDYFEVADDIRAEKVDDNYKIILTDKSGLETSIKHIGFGISQLLPIVVEGLRMPSKGTLIIEQPEIHLHPKLQSKVYDFLYGLTLQGKIVIVETHSSHFITRMRRRIAEDASNKMDDNIGLTFIEDNIFRSIELDDYGTMDYYPDDFIEQSNTELRAIIKAQMKKRSKND